METFVEKKTKTLSHIELTQIKKRDGTVVPFDLARIKNAITRAFESTKEGGEEEARMVSFRVYDILRQMKLTSPQFVPTVEQIQDLVEKELILDKFAVTAKSYILYRERHAEMRREARQVSERLRTLAKESKKYFRNPLAEIMYISMCGTGVGWSVESENIQSLPQVKRQTGKKLPTYVIPDSKEGWA